MIGICAQFEVPTSFSLPLFHRDSSESLFSLTLSASPLVSLQLQMLGYDVSWAAFNIVEVMSSSKFTYKVRLENNEVFEMQVSEVNLVRLLTTL